MPDIRTLRIESEYLPDTDSYSYSVTEPGVIVPTLSECSSESPGNINVGIQLVTTPEGYDGVYYSFARDSYFVEDLRVEKGVAGGINQYFNFGPGTWYCRAAWSINGEMDGQYSNALTVTVSEPTDVDPLPIYRTVTDVFPSKPLIYKTQLAFLARITDGELNTPISTSVVDDIRFTAWRYTAINDHSSRVVVGGFDHIEVDPEVVIRDVVAPSDLWIRDTKGINFVYIPDQRLITICSAPGTYEFEIVLSGANINPIRLVYTLQAN